MAKSKGLTPAERRWVEKLKSVLAECPSARIQAFTTGDNDITLYDSSLDDEICKVMDDNNRDFGGSAEEVGAVLCLVKLPFIIHSTAG